MWILWISLVISLIADAAGFAIPHGGSDPENTHVTIVQPYVEAVDFPQLILRFLPGSTATRRGISATGVSYLVSRSNGRGTQSFSAQIGVFRDEKLAGDALKRNAAFMMVGPTSSPEQIGDELLIFRSAGPESGSLLFRRMNVFVLLGPGLAMDERAVLARNIDTALQTDMSEVQHVTNLQLPEIAAVHLPATVHPRQVAEGRIDISGVGSFSITLGSDSGAVSIKMRPVPIIVYTAPSEAMQHEFELVLATAGNLISTKKIRMTVQ